VQVWAGGAVLALVAAGSSGVAADDLTVLGLGVEKTITCDQRDVVVSGANHRLTLRGRCERVFVHGTGNVVHVERLGRADMDGLNNRLEWEQALHGDRPVIRNTGVNSRAVRVDAGTSPDTAATDQPSVTVKGSGGGRVVVGSGGVSVEGSPRTRSATGGSVTISGSDVEQSHDCGGGSATVEGSDNRLTLTRCPELTVTGGGNHIVMVGPVRRIRLLGGENEVQWSEGEGGRSPKIETPGSDNRVIRK
jgi:hypothetical protein